MPLVESDRILQTKLRPTFVASRLLPRGRLLKSLQGPGRHRLVLVHSAAGSGKSSLLYDYVQNCTLPVAWYSLGDEDRDPQVFLTYVVKALSGTYPRMLERSESLLAGMPSAEAGWEDLAAAVINEVLHYRQPVTLVLDDYHLVASDSLNHRWIETLVTRGPDNLTLVIATRELPHLPLPFLRAKGALLEIRQEDLRFGLEEAATLFREVWEQDLEEDLLPVLMERTEGWITGLQLVAQAVRGRPEAERRRYIEALEGREEFIYNYLATEVFERQPLEVQRFLVRTSVVEGFDHGLAGALAGGNAYEMLHYLDSARLFLVHLDREGEWFRYHHLFRDFLRRRLAVGEGAEAVAELHLEAARWLEQHGDVVAAVPHYLASGDGEMAAATLERVGSELLTRGMLASVTAWMERLAPEVRRRAGLRMLEAEIRDLQGDWTGAVAGYEKALAWFRETGDQERAATVLEKLSLCYIKYGENQLLLQVCEEGLRHCPPDNEPLRAMLSSWLGCTLVCAGHEWDRGYELIRTSHELAHRCMDARALSWACMCYGFAFHFPQGNFTEALKVLNEGIDFFKTKGWPMATYQLTMNKAVVLILQGDLAAADSLVEDTLLLADRAGHTYVARGMQNLRAFILLERRDLRRAHDALLKEAEHHVPAQMRPWHYRNRMLLHTYEGNYEQARVASEEMQRALTLTGYGMYAPECLVSQAWLLACLGDFDEARAVLERCVDLSESGRCKFWAMKARVLQAWVAWETGEREDLLDRLGQALAATEANGYHEFWLTDPYRVTGQLLVAASAFRVCPDVVQRMVASLGEGLLPSLLMLMDSRWPEVRAELVRLLARMSSEEAFQALRFLQSEDPADTVRDQAERLLRVHPLSRPRLEFRALGPLEILRDGEPLTEGRPQVLKLLKYLLCHSERLVSADQIIEAFWPESPPERGRHSLSVHLSSIRKMLTVGKPGLESFLTRVGEGVRLQFGPDVEFDVLEFERLAAEGRNLLRRGDAEVGVARLLRAEALYRGDFLCEDFYDDWVLERRAELRARYDEVLEDLADRSRSDGRHEEAVERYRRILSGERLDEKVFQKMFDCFIRMGDRASAMLEYERFRLRMVEETGLEPAAPTRDLVKRMVTG